MMQTKCYSTTKLDRYWLYTNSFFIRTEMTQTKYYSTTKMDRISYLIIATNHQEYFILKKMLRLLIKSFAILLFIQIISLKYQTQVVSAFLSLYLHEVLILLAPQFLFFACVLLWRMQICFIFVLISKWNCTKCAIHRPYLSLPCWILFPEIKKYDALYSLQSIWCVQNKQCFTIQFICGMRKSTAYCIYDMRVHMRTYTCGF